jgi:hypothetical protein
LLLKTRRRNPFTTGCFLQIYSECCGATGPCPIPLGMAVPATMSIESKEETNMKEKKKIRISIHPVEDHPGDYLAYFRSEFLDATYTVFFKDTITGALALHSFAEMISPIVARHS